MSLLYIVYFRFSGGWGGIRTHEEPRDPCRFSRPVPSTARPPIRWARDNIELPRFCKFGALELATIAGHRALNMVRRYVQLSRRLGKAYTGKDIGPGAKPGC